MELVLNVRVRRFWLGPWTKMVQYIVVPGREMEWAEIEEFIKGAYEMGAEEVFYRDAYGVRLMPNVHEVEAVA